MQQTSSEFGGIIAFTADRSIDSLAPEEPGLVEVLVPTQQLEAELIATKNALRESDARFQTLADALPHMVWSTLPDGFHDYFNSRWHEFTGMPPGSTDGERWNAMFHPEDRERAWQAWRHCLASGDPYEIEYRLRHHSGEYRWTLGRAMPMRDEDGNIVRWIGTCTDIHEAKRISTQNEILGRELSHRIKNIFAVIAGLIGLSARHEPAQREFARTLQERVTALGRAHEFVRPHSSHSASQEHPVLLHGVLREILSPYPALAEGRLTIEGDDIAVDDRGATPLALLIHELATNATKYGALSTQVGEVRITTRIAGGAVELRWEESGGPEVRGPPEQTGFGTKLSELSIVQQLGGTLERDWRRDGVTVVCRIERKRLVRSSGE